MQIRPFDSASAAEYAAVLAIHNLCHPTATETPADWRARDDSRDPKYRAGRLVAAIDGAIVGYAGYDQNPYVYHPRKFTLELAVRPDFRRRGVGAALFDRLIAGLAPFDPLAVKAQAGETAADSLRFLQQRGFAETNRRWRSALDLARVDLAQYAGAETALREAGIVIATWIELAGDPERANKLYALDLETNQDTPEPDPITLPPPEQHFADILTDPRALPDALFIAVHNQRYVGRSNLDGRHCPPGALETDYTAVARDYRGRNIALALKLRGIAYAREHGYHTLITDNDSANWPMLAINERLGFVRQPATVYFEKRLAGER